MKFKFVHPGWEQTFCEIAKEKFGMEKEEFLERLNTVVDAVGKSTRVYLVYRRANNNPLYVPSCVIEIVKPFNPNGWNYSNVTPPEDEGEPGTSEIMLIENEYGEPHMGYYNFSKEAWFETGTGEVIECSRYRLYPY